MGRSWWELGEHSGVSGSELAINRIECPFCSERGGFAVEHHAAKRKPNETKVLNFDTLRCGNCRGYVMVLWSSSSYTLGPNTGIHDYLTLPWPQKIDTFPDHWPEAVGRHWKQAHRSLIDENWDAAAVMARSAMQAALRDRGAVGGSLKKEIDDLCMPDLET